MISLKYLAAATLAAIAGIGTAQAATTADFQVRITIAESCTISAGDVAFGSVTRSTDATATGTLTVNCSQGTPYTIALNNGTNSGTPTAKATATSRLLKKSGDTTDSIPYGLYLDGSHTAVWANDASDASSEKTGTGNGDDQDLTVYARVLAANTNVPAGDYVDTVTATVTF